MISIPDDIADFAPPAPTEDEVDRIYERAAPDMPGPPGMFDATLKEQVAMALWIVRCARMLGHTEREVFAAVQDIFHAGPDAWPRLAGSFARLRRETFIAARVYRIHEPDGVQP